MDIEQHERDADTRYRINGCNCMKIFRLTTLIMSSLLLAQASWAMPSIIVKPVGFSGQTWVSNDARIGLKIPRPLLRQSGRLAIMLNHIDLGSLFRPISPDEFSYDGRQLPLPSGEHELQAYWVTEAGHWQALSSLPIKVLTPSGFEQAVWNPRLELSSESQFTEDPQGDVQPSERGESYHSAGIQMGIQSQHRRGGLDVETLANFVGSSDRQAALRFNEEGEEAPKVDLSDYRVAVTKGGASLSQGDVSFGNQPLLIDNLSNRGLVYNQQLSKALSFAITAQSSRALVGVDNPLGYTESDSRSFATTLGVQMMPQEPGRLYSELTYFNGRALSDRGFNVGEITDAVDNSGYAIRLGGKGFNGRLRGVFDFAVSRFVNPDDADLAQGNEIVQGVESEDSAYRLNLAYDLLSGGYDSMLTLSYLFSRTDPLYQVLAASPLADTEIETWRLQGSLSSVDLLLEYVRSEDNLDEIDSILKTRTKDLRFSLTLPLDRLFEASSESFWRPRNIGYSLQRVHQFGVNKPLGFDPQSHIPDQLNLLHSLNLDWSGASWELGYNLSYSDQDNRQTGRANADFQDLTQGLFFGLRPSDRFSIRLNFDYTRARDDEAVLNRYTRSYTLDADWTISDEWALTGNYGFVEGYDSRSLESSDQTTAQTQLSWRFNLSNPAGGGALPGQLFLRHDYLDQHAENREFDFISSGDNWALHGGISLNIF